MRLPFAVEQFLSVFARHGEAIGPARVGSCSSLLAGVLGTALLARRRSEPGRPEPRRSGA